MIISEIHPYLISLGIPDLTNDIHWGSANPITGGGFSDIYSGKLTGSHSSTGSIPDGTGDTYTLVKPTHAWEEPIPEQLKCQEAAQDARLTLSAPPPPHMRLNFDAVGRLKNMDPAPVAIKIRRRGSDSALHYWQVASGIQKWSKLQHPNVLKLLGFVLFQVHGDIKGGNILLSSDGTAMLADLDEAELGECSLTFTGKTGGQGMSLRWAAPELIADAGFPKKTYRSDVYAL
ncbi:hypothetical protein FRC11_002360 [Ceratobasidium sp. 423]|nr:hypothetical protein FRC11_002360 [Ceratobasidium sp. 423]